MPGWNSRIWEYLSSIGIYWYGGVALMLATERYAERLFHDFWKKRVDPWLAPERRRQVLFGFIVVGFFVSNFRAFDEQRQAYRVAISETGTARGERDAANMLADERQREINRQMAQIETLQLQLQEQRSLQQSPPTTSVLLQKYVCTTLITALKSDHFAILIEFGSKTGSTTGFASAIATNVTIDAAEDWIGQPLRTDVPQNRGGVTTDSSSETKDNVFRRQFSSPNITPSQSEYVYLESQKPIAVTAVLFLENFRVLSDPLNAKKMGQNFGPCPR